MEQSMIGFGAGLSKAGYIPIIHTIAPFLVLRALDQIKIDLIYNKLRCNIISVGAANDYPKLGTTHHCFEDINILTNYPNLNIFIPSGPEEFQYLLKKNYKKNSLNYFRISESKRTNIFNQNCFIRNKKNKNLLIIVGNSVDEKNINSKKVDIYYVNHIYNNMKLDFIKSYQNIVIIEPYFGNVLERIIRHRNFTKQKIKTVGYEQTIIHKYGTKSEQDKFLNFDSKNINKKINNFI